MSWKARFIQAIPELVEKHPGAKWLFLTLTVKNCEIENLRTTLVGMNDAWHRLIKRKEFRHVIGWIRTTEVTYGKDGTAHPHFHVLMMVAPSMASGVNYVKQAEWTELWKSVARLDYTPLVNVKGVKPRDMSWDEARAKGIDANALASVAAEVLKYSVKPSDMVENQEWFLELTRQTHKMRFVATGGALKGLLTAQASKEEMLCADGDSDNDGEPDAGVPLAAFSWDPGYRSYHREQSRDAQARPHRRGAPRERPPAGSG